MAVDSQIVWLSKQERNMKCQSIRTRMRVRLGVLALAVTIVVIVTIDVNLSGSTLSSNDTKTQGKP